MRTKLLLTLVPLTLTAGAAGQLTADNPPSLAFSYQLFSNAVDDSISVVFVVSGTNLGESSSEICGAFYFNCGFTPVPEMPSKERRCPSFYYIDPKMDLSLNCEPTMLRPGESISDTLRFTYSPDYFAPCSGNIELGAEFIYGKPGTFLNEARRIGGDLLRARMPID